MSLSLADLTNLTESELLKNHDLDQFVSPFPCEVCTTPGYAVCTICYDTWYCSSEHQQSDLKNHKPNCTSPLEVKTNDQIGRHFVASRDLKAGALILDEPPTFWGPRADKGCNSVYCLSCCVLMESENETGCGFRACSRCHWPVCSPACEENRVHAKQECDFFANNQVPYPTRFDAYITYKSVFLVRGLLLKESDPTLWSELHKLDDVAPKLGKISLFPNLQMFKKIFGVPQSFGGSPEDWNKIQGIINVNAFWTLTDSKCAHFIFLKASTFAHSCSPNAAWDLRFTTETSSEPRMRIRTTTKIKKGEIVAIAYVVDYPKKGTEERQNQNSGFVCKCARCIDPTEFGTYNSAMKCECGGYLLPGGSDDVWKCNEKEHECTTIPGSRVTEICTSLCNGLQEIHNVVTIEDYICKELNGVLHPNHWILIEASSRIILETSPGIINGLLGKELDRYIWHCRKILEVYDVTIPGLSKHRGLILRALGPPFLRKLDQELTSKNKKDTLTQAVKMYELLKEAFLCLKDHPTSTPIPPDNYCLRDYSILLLLNSVKEFIHMLEHVHL